MRQRGQRGMVTAELAFASIGAAMACVLLAWVLALVGLLLVVFGQVLPLAVVGSLLWGLGAALDTMAPTGPRASPSALPVEVATGS